MKNINFFFLRKIRALMPYEKSLIKDLFGRKGKKAEKGKTE
jgi:hypothetical protein